MGLDDGLDEYDCSPQCGICLGTGLVCSVHPDKAYLDGSCCDAPALRCPVIDFMFGGT